MPPQVTIAFNATVDSLVKVSCSMHPIPRDSSAPNSRWADACEPLLRRAEDERAAPDGDGVAEMIRGSSGDASTVLVPRLAQVTLRPPAARRRCQPAAATADREALLASTVL